jgi:hypothetical protein
MRKGGRDDVAKPGFYHSFLATILVHKLFTQGGVTDGKTDLSA